MKKAYLYCFGLLLATPAFAAWEGLFNFQKDSSEIVREFSDSGYDTVYFAFDSSALSSEAVATLDNQAAWLNKNNKVNVVVQGYCDVKEGYAECDDLENTSETPTDAIELSDSDNSLETLADTMEQPVSNDKDSCAYNAVLALGERRAEAVKQYLVSQGVAADRITTVSYGKEYAFPGDTEEAYAKSRRGVTIVE